MKREDMKPGEKYISKWHKPNKEVTYVGPHPRHKEDCIVMDGSNYATAENIGSYHIQPILIED
jgi:hypothetical protein